jgi:hypothetical protein
MKPTRAKAQGKRLGRPMVAAETETAIRERLATGAGILKVAKGLGVGVSTVQRAGGRRQPWRQRPHDELDCAGRERLPCGTSACRIGRGDQRRCHYVALG